MGTSVSVTAIRAAQTTGTAMMARLRLQSADLGLAAGAADFALPSASGAGIATNSGGFAVPVSWIALDFEAGGGNVVNLALSQMGIEPADNYSVEAGVAHLAGDSPPAKWFDYAALGGVMPRQGEVSS